MLSGHVHQSPFTRDGSWADRIGDTWVFNAGHQIGPLPSHIVVDTERPGAYWCSLAATEVTPLTGRRRPALRAGGRPAALAARYGSTGSSDAGMKPLPCSWASASSTSSTMPR